ncbi:hypothetical protein Tco_1457944 [Tanacetum coccineum]
MESKRSIFPKELEEKFDSGQHGGQVVVDFLKGLMGKSESKSDATKRSLWLSEAGTNVSSFVLLLLWNMNRNARLLQDKLKAEELAKDKIEAEKVPHFEDHVPPHIIRPKSLSAFIFCQLAATLSEISRRSSLESYDHWHGLRFLRLSQQTKHCKVSAFKRLRGQCAWRKSGD